MFCKYCGQTIDDDSAFCSHCGKSLQTSGFPQHEPSIDASTYVTVNQLLLERKELGCRLKEWEAERYPGIVIWGVITSIVCFFFALLISSVLAMEFYDNFWGALASIIGVSLLLVGSPIVLFSLRRRQLYNNKFKKICQLENEIQLIDEKLNELRVGQANSINNIE